MAGAAGPLGPTLLWIGVLLVLFVGGGVAIYFLRRYARGGDKESAGPALTLNQVRQMRQRGEITEEEYQRLKRTVVEETRKPPADQV